VKCVVYLLLLLHHEVGVHGIHGRVGGDVVGFGHYRGACIHVPVLFCSALGLVSADERVLDLVRREIVCVSLMHSSCLILLWN
jgi:hypothetical protein